MSASDYLEQKLLDHVFGKGAYTVPSIWVALCTVAISDTDDGSTITEASYTGYARKSTAASDWSRSGSIMSNANAITFVECSGGSSTVSWVALVDSATTGAGNVLFCAQLTSSLSVSDGIQPYFAANDIQVTAS